MALNQPVYFKQRIEQLRHEIKMQTKTIEDLQQRVDMLRAELFAFETALQLAGTPQDINIEPPGDTAEPLAELGRGKGASLRPDDFAEEDGSQATTSLADTLRAILRERTGGAVPSDLYAEFRTRGRDINRAYLYSLLSRMTANHELRRRYGKYYLQEQWQKRAAS